MGALLGEPGGGVPLLGALKVMKGRLWGWESLFMGAQLGNLEWAHLPRTLRYGWKDLWSWSVSLCGSSVKGTWREGSLARDPEGYLEKALETGISFHRGSIWRTWRSFRLPGTLRAGWRGCRDGAPLSQEAPWRGPRGGVLYCGTRTMRFLRDIQNAL